MYYIFGITIDLLAPITGEQQRMFGGDFTLLSLGIMRPAGLHSEPGTYGIIMSPLIAIYSRYYSYSFMTKLIFWLSIVSLFLTFSTYSIIFGILILTVNKFISYKFKFFSLSLLILFVSGYITYRFFGNLDASKTGIGFRSEFIYNSFQYLTSSASNFFWGANLMAYDPKIEVTQALNDSGLIIYLSHFLGYVFTFILLIFISIMLRNMDRYSILSLCFIFLSKMSIFFPLFPFYMAIALKKIKIIYFHPAIKLCRIELLKFKRV